MLVKQKREESRARLGVRQQGTNGTKELNENSCRDLTQLIEYTGRRKG